MVLNDYIETANCRNMMIVYIKEAYLAWQVGFLHLKLTHHAIAIGKRPEKLSTTKIIDDKQYGHNDDKNAYTPHR